MPEIRGVDPHIFDISAGEKKQEFTHGLISGRALLFSVTKRHIEITDKENTNFRFSATDDLGNLYITVTTKGYEGDKEKRHPDLFAADLVKLSLTLFDKMNNDIKEWHATWTSEEEGNPNDNYSEFERNLPQKDTYTLGELQNAAVNTWEGRLANELGFTKTAQVRYFPGISCYVDFERESKD
ncbi:MAG: hypothetical protein ABI758_01190 [Candidatus Woesebacteria bacterium]